MKTTITIDKAGRIVIPKGIRERMHLTEGSRLQIEVLGERLQLSREADTVQLERRGRRRVIVGGEAFDAGEAIRADHEQQLNRVAGAHQTQSS